MTAFLYSICGNYPSEGETERERERWGGQEEEREKEMTEKGKKKEGKLAIFFPRE